MKFRMPFRRQDTDASTPVENAAEAGINRQLSHEAVSHITRRLTAGTGIDPQDRVLAEAIAEILAAKEKADRENQVL